MWGAGYAFDPAFVWQRVILWHRCVDSCRVDRRVKNTSGVLSARFVRTVSILVNATTYPIRSSNTVPAGDNVGACIVHV